MPPPPSTPDSRYPPARGAAGRHDEGTPSQLDRIAAVNAHAKRQARGSLGPWLAALAVVVLLVWAYGRQLDRPDASVPEPAARAVAAPLVATVPPVTASEPALASAAPPEVAAEAVPPGTSAPAASAPSTPAIDRARLARAKQEAETRAKALQEEQALARTLAEAQERERREAEQARELADEAKRRTAEAALVRAAPTPTPETQRNVRELCSASSNFVSEQFCRSRECRKAQHQGDAICVRLREIEEARRLGGQQ